MSKRRVKNRSYVALYWMDAEGDSGWGDDMNEPPWVVTVGFVLKRPTKKRPWWKIADSFCEGQPGGVTIIPFHAEARELGTLDVRWRDD